MQFVEEAGASQHFREKSFRRQKENSEIRGMRRIDIFVRDRFGRISDRGFERRGCGFHGDQIGCFGGNNQPLIIFTRKFRVDGQVDIRTIRIARRKPDREFDALRTVGCHSGIHDKLIRRQIIVQQHAELDFRPCAPRLDVGEDALEIADACCQLLHLAKPFMHMLELFADRVEGFSQPFFQRRLQFLVDGLHHLFELFAIVLAQHLKAGFNRLPQLLLPLGGLLGKRLDSLGKFIQPLLLIAAHLAKRLGDQAAGLVEILG